MKLIFPILRFLLVAALCLFIADHLHGQNPGRFKKEVDSLVAINKSFNTEDVILFTGSSSIRLWHSLKSSFPKYNILNLGFGGSEMSDLLYYTDELIIPYEPNQIFIYEGDNDISNGRTPEEIIASADKILGKIRKRIPKSEVIFISPKPSLKRWSLKEKYEVYNQKLKSWAAKQKNVRYADVWNPMLDSNGIVFKDIFLEDGLHLNRKGYEIWTHELGKYLPSVQR